MRLLCRSICAVFLVCFLLGCGSAEVDGQETDTRADAGGADGGTTPDVRGDAAGAGGELDASFDFLPDGDVDSSHTFVNFEYRKIEEAGHSTLTGIEVTLVGNTRIIKHGSNSRNERLESEDAETLYTEYLTDEVLEKMRAGSWECGEAETHNGARHEFRAELGTQVDAPQPTRVVSGCIAPDASHPDAELVQRIADQLEALRGEYFE